MDLDQVMREVDESGDKEGWAQELPGPLIFHVDEREDGGLDWFFPEALNQLFITLCVERGMEAHDALQWIADRTEKSVATMQRWGFSTGVATRMRGIGIRSEAWALLLEETGGLDPDKYPDDVEGHPNAKSIRMVQFFDRNGTVRTMVREMDSGKEPSVVDDDTASGGIPNAMSRILNAMVDVDVPICSPHHPGCGCEDEPK